MACRSRYNHNSDTALLPDRHSAEVVGKYNSWKFKKLYLTFTSAPVIFLVMATRTSLVPFEVALGCFNHRRVIPIVAGWSISSEIKKECEADQMVGLGGATGGTLG